LGYGARTLNEGGWYGLPKLWGNGFLLVGESAGLLDTLRLKGVHLAIESGILAAETALDALGHDDVSEERLSALWRTAWRPLASGQNSGERAISVRRFVPDGSWDSFSPRCRVCRVGVAWSIPWRTRAGYAEMRRVAEVGHGGRSAAHADDRADGQLTFDRTTALAASRVSHEEDQPVHLLVADPDLCAVRCRDDYENPCQRFCPAGVYELVVDRAGARPRLLIHARTACTARAARSWTPTRSSPGCLRGRWRPSYEGL